MSPGGMEIEELNAIIYITGFAVGKTGVFIAN
jgi:hypothetical protein